MYRFIKIAAICGMCFTGAAYAHGHHGYYGYGGYGYAPYYGGATYAPAPIAGYYPPPQPYYAPVQQPYYPQPPVNNYGYGPQAPFYGQYR